MSASEDPGGPDDPGPSRTGRRIGLLVVGGLIVVAVVLAAGAWWYLDRDNPEEVDLDRAAEGVEDTSEASQDGTSTTQPSARDLTGTWTVDTTTGEFDFQSATGTFAGFRIDEELASVGATEAVGRTGDVSGTFVIDGTTVTEADFEVAMQTITTDQSRRDDRVQQALETDRFPTATFTLTQPIELGPEAASGQDVSVTAVGDLTLHGVTRPVQVPLEARLVDGTVVVVGSFDISLADYGIEIPQAPSVISVSDIGTIELQFLLRR